MTMQLSPPSTTILLPFNQAPATQQLQILNPSKEVVRIRFKVGYNINGAQVFEMGEFFATS